METHDLDLSDPSVRAQTQYLFDYLAEEFRGQDSAAGRFRVRLVRQDQVDGVLVRNEAREYFFPLHWATEPGLLRVKTEVARIRDALGER